MQLHTESAVPMNNIYRPKLIGCVPGSFRNSWYSPHAIAHPRPKGSIIPANPTLRATLQFDINKLMFTSSPTRNRKRIKPTFATRLRFGIAAVGKIASSKPSMRIRTDGPRMIPPMTSAITLGCRILERGQCSIRQKIMIIIALWIISMFPHEESVNDSQEVQTSYRVVDWLLKTCNLIHQMLILRPEIFQKLVNVVVLLPKLPGSTYLDDK